MKKIDFTKEEKIKVVKRAIEFLKNDEDEFICNTLIYAIVEVKELDYFLDRYAENELLNKHFSDLLEVANKYLKDNVENYAKYGVYCIDNFAFNGKAWFSTSALEYKELRLKLLELYLEQLKNN